jgi:type IV pilus assembly protein PilC
MTAANENELAHYLGGAGMELIAAREEKPLRLSLATRNLPPRVLAAFCARMHDLLQSGIVFPDALQNVTDATSHKILRDALMQISRAIAAGNGIAAAFALYPRLFPQVFVAIIAAGENSGDMIVIFDFLARYADNRATTQEKLRRALRYPLFLFFVAGGAVSFMLATVVPQVVQFLNGIQGTLPLATRMLVALSTLFTTYSPYVLAGATCAVAMLVLGRLAFPAFAVALDAAWLRLPVIGAVIAKTALARFAHSFAILFRSGCEVPDCLRQAGATITNRALRARLQDAEKRVQAGAALLIALDGVMPVFATGLLRIGERSGRLGKCLDDIAIAYDREAQTATDAFIGMLEPALTVLIGGLLAWTVAAMLGPLYGSLAVLGGRV